MEYLVKISKKEHILELKRRHLKITVLTSNTPYPSRKIRCICACTSLKTIKEQDPIRRIQKKTNTLYSSYGNKIFWKISNVVPTPRNPRYAVLTSVNTPVFVQKINTVYLDPLNTAYWSSDTVTELCMTRSSTKELFTPFKEPEREFRSSRNLFKTLSLDESRSPEFNLFSNLEEYSEEEVAETMAETMEQYMSKTRADYGSGISRPKIDDKDSFELKG
ncbi:hypothetical protein Tco_0054432 [Tanacetum coccineum]